ncbi:MAG: hypothetical protein QM503_06605 [Bacteroidota bacterium]
MNNNKSDYFILEHIDISKQGQIVQFETKLPARAKRLVGYQISSNKHHSTKAIATVGISFNGARQNTINNELINRDPSTIKRRTESLGQNMILLQNSYAKGFVEDLAVVAVPYTVKIYFMLSQS